jgi:UDP-2-acetamido-2,6-beta-L-arabino-hexul-4-ose reductase
LNIVITGASGFIAKNLIASLRHVGTHQLLLMSKASTIKELRQALSDADFVFHLAGVNRPQDSEEFYQGNASFTKTITSELLSLKKRIPIVFSSSTQALLDNDYGKSKRQAEDVLMEYAKTASAPVKIFRLPGVFGKWSKPNYNSVVATFCHQIANEEPIEISDPSKQIELVYIDTVIDHFLSCLTPSNNTDPLLSVSPKVSITLGELASKIKSFQSLRHQITLANLSNPLDKQLFVTFTSFIPLNQLRQPLMSHRTENSVFAEAIKSPSFGQLSINEIQAGAVRGNHWHHSKHEKFLVIQGKGVIRLRNLFSKEVITLPVSGEQLEWIEILPGYVHNIENVGTTPLITVMWANEMYDAHRPDTFAEVV